MNRNGGHQHRYRTKPDGTPHVIDDNGRTCSVGGDYHPWAKYRKSKGSYTGHAARCISCSNKGVVERRHKRLEVTKKAKIDVFFSPVNIFLMTKCDKTPSFCA